MKTRRTAEELALEYETRGNQCLADANEAAERGSKKTAERLYERGQKWLDKWIKITGRGDE